MITTKAILALVKQYSDKKIPLDEFSHSFADLFYDIEVTGDPDAVQLAYTIESKLAAVAAGVCSESVLREALTSLLPSVSIVVSDPIFDSQVGLTQFIVTGHTGFLISTEAGNLVRAGTGPSAGFSLVLAPLSAPQTNIDLLLTQQVLEAR